MVRIPFDSLHRPQMAKGDYARARSTSATYISRTFENANSNSRDYRAPSRFVHRVFDDEERGTGNESTDTQELTIAQLSTRTQLRALVTRAAGTISELEIQSVPTSGDPKRILRLNRHQTEVFLEFFRTLENIDPVGGEDRIRVDDSTTQAFLTDGEAMAKLYEQGEEVIRALIAADADATDVIAVAHRKKVVTEFAALLEDAEHFDSVRDGAKPESVWQKFFEANPWLLGVGLSDQLLTSWDPAKLEKAVTGRDLTGPGKRADAVLRTAGAVRSMVFAEIKHHRTQLLRSRDYRVMNYSPTDELAGGVAQVQGTVHAAVEHVGHLLQGENDEGFRSHQELAYLVAPKSYLIVGRLDEFRDEDAAVHDHKATSFELYRRNLHAPEIITFDELLARARWMAHLD